jgi:hypothetical protein
MKIKLALTSDKDLEKKPATFVMLSSFPDAEVSFGLGARRRTFNFASELVQALEPAHFSPGYLRQLEIGLEQGKDVLEEVSAEQAAAIGMLPARNGFEWLRVTVHKTGLGDGSFRYTVTYRSGGREVSGSGLETIDNLELHVREFVALDWKAITRTLETEERWSGLQLLPLATLKYIFEGEK